jgi:uncharacterized RDD family membrane protein YckC
MTSVPEPSAEPTEDTPTAPSGQEDVLGRRLGAALIDLALLVGLFVVLALAIGEAEVEDGGFSLYLEGGAAAVYFGLVLLYYFALEAAFGQTVGKFLLALRVVRADGSRPSAAAIAVRTLLRIVDWLPFLYLVGFITMMATGHRRMRLGDLAAKTILARTQPTRRRSLAFAPVALLLVLIVVSSVYRAADSGGGKSTDAVRRSLNTLRLPPTGAVLFRDDFSNRRRGWYVGQDRDSATTYAAGRYRMAIPETTYYNFVWNALDRAADAISVTGLLRQSAGGAGDELGVLCISSSVRPRDKAIQGYVLGIGPSDGYVAVRRLLSNDLSAESFVEREGEDAVEPRGDINRIRADCFGARQRAPARLTLYANGKLIGQATVPRGFKRFDSVGVYTYNDSGGTTALFDDLVVRELKRTD